MFYRAKYLLQGTDWIRDAAMEVLDDQIIRIGTAGELLKDLDTDGDDTEVVDLGDVAVVPGQVNAHSHAFQRAIRGRTEYLDASRPEDDFWSWREAMYGAALQMDADAVEQISRLAFREMARAGYTTVGEFHYLHHRPDGTPYEDPNELAHRVIRAARDVGLRIAVLRVAYNRAGHDKDPNPRQRRFIEGDIDVYLDRYTALSKSVDEDGFVSVGMAPHSIRAVPRQWLEAIAAHGAGRDVPVHIHACEQRAELEQSEAEYGRTPVAALESMGFLNDRVTLIHGTHLSAVELDMLADHQPTVCACPTTERNLGDGFLPAHELASREIPIALGSDSQATIAPFEEMRLVEYHERLRHERRNVLAEHLAEDSNNKSAGRLETADVLWSMGTEHGARSLGLPTGRLDPGRLADFVTLDLDHISLAGADETSLLANIVFSMSDGAVSEVYVGGEQIVENGTGK